MTCDKCGASLQIGRWPWCPHGVPEQGLAVISDELPNGPYWCETLGHEPVYVTSKSHLRREAEARGLENVVRHTEAYHVMKRKRHDEELRDTGIAREY